MSEPKPEMIEGVPLCSAMRGHCAFYCHNDQGPSTCSFDRKYIQSSDACFPAIRAIAEENARLNTARKSEIRIEIYQKDWMPGFAAFAENGSLQKGAAAHVALNVGALMAGVEGRDIPPADLPYVIADILMHEVIHVLESWAKVEFSEERVEALIAKYRQAYPPPLEGQELCGICGKIIEENEPTAQDVEVGTVHKTCVTDDAAAKAGREG